MLLANRWTRRVTTLLWLALALVFAIQAKAQTKPEVYTGKPAKYVFLFIGDGMASAQRTSAEHFMAAEKGMDKPGYRKSFSCA
jgi:alkaline phosphatase